MNKETVIDIVQDVRNEVQRMREEGDRDLRTVLYHLDDAIIAIKRLKEDD